MKIEVICTYELPSTREIDLPIDSWEDLESWYVKDGVLYYKIHNMPWESEKLEAFAPFNDGGAPPFPSHVYVRDIERMAPLADEDPYSNFLECNLHGDRGDGSRKVVEAIGAKADERVIRHIKLADLIPPDSEDWFPHYCLENLPATSGKTVHSFITSDQLADIVEDSLRDADANEAVLARIAALRRLGSALVDIEEKVT